MNTEAHEKSLDMFESLIDEFYCDSMASLKEFLANIERNLIVAALGKTNGDQRKAADILGIKPTTLHEKMKRFHIYIRKVAV